MKNFYLFLAAMLLSFPALGHAENDLPKVSLSREVSYTAKGHTDETLMDITVEPGLPSLMTGIEISLSASPSDVSSVSLKKDGKVLKTLPVKKGKTAYKFGIKSQVDYPAEYTIAVNISPDAAEGGKVSAEVKSVSFKSGVVTPEAPDPGCREILLVRNCLFRPGDYGSKFWRIPAILQLSDGILLTVNDRRNDSEKDLPHEIDVVSRYSTDGGRTWSEPVYVAKNEGYMNGYGDPSLAELPDGTVVCLFCGGETFTRSCPENPQRSYYALSHDHGRTWDAPVDITHFIWGKDPANPFCKRYHSSFFSSGNTLVLKDGPHAGRILSANVTTYQGWSELCDHATYSDDGGKTWNVSDLAFGPGGDEAKMVQLLDGSILMSIRQNGKRAWAISKDYGQTWTEHGFWDDMNVTACNGDMIRYNDKMLLHTVPNSMGRENVSVFVSYDEGKTWPYHKTICKGPSQYSSITVLPDGTVGAYIEENPNRGEGTQLWFESFSLEWLLSK